MSALPPDIVGSALQAGYIQRESARVADAARASQAHAAERHLRAVDEAATNVETTDDDVQIFSDAEGTGGQGRPFSEEAEEETENAENGGAGSAAADAPHLDIQA